MSKLTWLKTALLATAIVPAIGNATDRVGDFSLLDQDGYFHSMSWYDDHVAIAFLVQANGSQSTSDALPVFDALKTRYASQGVEFMMINPMGLINREAVQAQIAAYGVDIPVLMDDARIVSEAMGIDKTGEVFVFNPRKFTVEYRGTVAALESALQQLIAGEEVSNAIVATTGSAVTYPVAVSHQQTPVSYENDIAPIIAENCASCHRAGGIAPFAMDSHTMLQGWAPMIREVLMTKRMPPGQLDGHVGNFINDMLITDEEIQKVVHWVEAGAPIDGDSDPLTELTWSETKWAFGEPDYIIQIPAQTIPATGVLDYRYITVPIDTEKDYWVRGSQYVAGDRTVLHHTLNNIVEPGASRRGSFLGGSNPDQASIAAYIPGSQPRMDPPNTGGLLKAGSSLNLQLHYTTNGRESVDSGEIGLWFYPDGEVPKERMSGDCACIFTPTWTNIPPNDPAFEQTETITIAKDAYIHSMLSHMHFRGKYMRFYADYPDGSKEELINIANYNYNWQLAYTYEEPKFVPAGTRITVVGAFDNSAQNPSNPDPERSVPWGQQSWDEMFFGAVQFKYADQGSD